MAPTVSNVCLRWTVIEFGLGQSITQSRLAALVCCCHALEKTCKRHPTQGSMRHHGLVTKWTSRGLVVTKHRQAQ